MNDFTKEELIYMGDGLSLIITTCTVKDDLKEKIIDCLEKIQSMIDNYCAHEEEILEGARMKIHTGKCMKCGIKL